MTDNNHKLKIAAGRIDSLSRRMDALTSSRKDATKSDVMKKIQSASKEALHTALRHLNTDPQVKKLIEKELDERANRGV